MLFRRQPPQAIYELVTRDGCHLCDEMAALLDAVLPGYDLSWSPRDVDAVDAAVKGAFEHGLGSQPWSTLHLIFYGTALVMLGTFGCWSVVAVAMAFWIRKDVPAAIWAFPLFVMANGV